MQKLEAILSEYGVVIDNPEAVKASHALCAVLQELLGPKGLRQRYDALQRRFIRSVRKSGGVAA